MQAHLVKAVDAMVVCDNDQCSAFGDDTPDMFEHDRQHRCFMCGVPKVSWRTVPVAHLSDRAYKLVEAANLASDPLR
jgi:hypothetical protein